MKSAVQHERRNGIHPPVEPPVDVDAHETDIMTALLCDDEGNLLTDDNGTILLAVDLASSDLVECGEVGTDRAEPTK
jgi:hypothetical protein